MSEKVCPFNGGQHKKKPWVEKDETGRRPKRNGRCGLSCVLCHKTWEMLDGGIVRENYS